MDAILKAHQLTKTFKSVKAVRGIDIEISPREWVALLGPNGAGKTTTLFMVLGVISPDSGWIEVVGHRMPRHRSEAMQRVGFAAGYMPLAERLRVREFLGLYGQLYGIKRPEGRIREALERFRIGHLSETMSNELSSGQRTLVGIVKATLHEPQLLVLDEPTASLDPDVASRLRDGLRDLCREKGTSLLVTSHNMTEVERICERVIFLSAGQVVADGTPAEVAARFSRDDLEGVFLHLAAEGAEDKQLPSAHETERPA